MAQIVQRPQSWAEALGTGLGSGLQTLANFKLQELQRKQMRSEEFAQKQLYQEQTKQALRQAGLPESWALFDPGTLSQLVKYQMAPPGLGEALYSYVTGKPLTRKGFVESGSEQPGKAAISAKRLTKETLPSAKNLPNGKIARNPQTNKVEFIVKNGEWVPYSEKGI